MRNINIGGLILDSKNSTPIEGASIYDEDNHLLDSTDENGYFRICFEKENNLEIRFNLTIKVDNYISFSQKEHWGDISGDINCIYYFGIKEENSNVNTFSNFKFATSDISYETVIDNLSLSKRINSFNNKIKDLTKGNEKIFFKIDNAFYIINNFGWIKIESKNDLISINGKKNVIASKLNSLIERKYILGMSPSDVEGVDYYIYTNEQ